MTRILLFMVSCVFTHNIVLGRMMGAGALTDGDRSIENAALLGLVVTVIMTVSAAVNWLIGSLLLTSLNAQYLQIPAFVLVIALAIVCVEQLCSSKLPLLAGQTVPLTAVCALLGISVLNAQAGYGIGDAILNGLFSGLGFLLAIVLMAGVQERIRFSRVPQTLKGFPISLISASLMALAFMGFMGMA